MDTTLITRVASLVFSLSGTVLFSILGYLLLFRALLPAVAGMISSFRRDAREEPLMALLSVLMLLFLISTLTLATYNPEGLRAILRPLVFA